MQNLFPFLTFPIFYWIELNFLYYCFRRLQFGWHEKVLLRQRLVSIFFCQVRWTIRLLWYFMPDRRNQQGSIIFLSHFFPGFIILLFYESFSFNIMLYVVYNFSKTTKILVQYTVPVQYVPWHFSANIRKISHVCQLLFFRD